MAWYDRILGRQEKLNPIQQYLGMETEYSREFTESYEKYYETLEIVNRGVNLIVDDVAEIPGVINSAYPNSVVKNIRKSRVDLLLNKEPNPFQDISSFKRNFITDYLLDGNIFIYYDGAHLYHLPADKVTIHGDSKTFIEKYTYNDVDYSPDEIIHVKENSFYSIYRGTSRLKPSVRTMQLMSSMRRPLILDGGIEIDEISNVNFKELDFQTAIAENEKIILKALGIPPIMLDSGNNANIRPNMRMYYLETVLPIVRKINYAYSRYFGFDITEDVTNIPALQPELRDQSQYYSALVNTGIISPNEARDALGFKGLEGYDELRVPANIAGSAANPDEGGRPAEGEESE
jgi:phage portal protein BeeE